MQARLFDSVYTSHPFWDRVENFFEFGGKTRRFSVLSADPTHVKPAPNSPRSLLQTLLKTAAFATLVIPLLLFAAKVYFHTSRSFTLVQEPKPEIPARSLPSLEEKPPISEASPETALILSPPPPAPERPSQPTIDSIWKSFDSSAAQVNTFTTTTNLMHRLTQLIIDNHQNRLSSTVSPDDCYASNPLLRFREDPRTLLLPSIFYSSQLEELAAAVQEGFATGRSLVVTRFSNSMHTVALVFEPNGHFRFIDSMGIGQVLDLKLLKQALEQKTSKKWKGSYIHTHLQKGGHECIRFATAFAYACALFNDAEGYKKVIGGFQSGLLHRYEDLSNCANAPSVDSGSSLPRESYTQFMESWALRCLGLPHNSYKDITLGEMRTIHRMYSESCYLLSSSSISHAYCNPNLRYRLTSPSGAQTFLSNYYELPLSFRAFSLEENSETIGSLSPSLKGERFLLVLPCSNSTQPTHLYTIPPGYTCECELFSDDTAVYTPIF